MDATATYSLRETDERAYRGAVVLRLYLGAREVGVAHVQRWDVPSVPSQVVALMDRHPQLRGFGLLAPSWLSVYEQGAGHGLNLLAELTKYAARRGCILFSSSLVAPGFASAQALRAWQSSRLRAIPGLAVGDRCAGWLA